MTIQFSKVDNDTMSQLEHLKEEYPEVVLRNVDAGIDGNVATELVIAIIPAIIEAVGAIIAALIVTRSKTEKEPIIIIVDIGNGRKIRIHKPEDWEKIKVQIKNVCQQ